jgi:HPt (histidine-containing phosphotransfer) domain-containing protein
VPPEPVEDLRAIDNEVLERLTIDVGDDRELVRNVIATYLGELDRRYGAIALAHQSGDLGKLEATAHELSSASVILGVVSVAKPAKALELAAVAGDRDATGELLSTLGQSLSDARVALTAW